MAKGNPIVGLAHVVVSQQEMLEKANEQIEGGGRMTIKERAHQYGCKAAGGWLHSFTGEIVLNDELRKALKESFPPELFRIHMLSNPPQDDRPRSYTITAKEADAELDAAAISAFMHGRGGKTYVMKNCKIERKKREYRHSNPSKYNKRNKRNKRK